MGKFLAFDSWVHLQGKHDVVERAQDHESEDQSTSLRLEKFVFPSWGSFRQSFYKRSNCSKGMNCWETGGKMQTFHFVGLNSELSSTKFCFHPLPCVSLLSSPLFPHLTVLLGIKVRALHMVRKHSTTELYLQIFLFWDRVLLNCQGWPQTYPPDSASQVAIVSVWIYFNSMQQTILQQIKLMWL